ncbi:MAG: OB-fold nucleic acid binding domain-containing protein [archaeon GB-1867-005]|nr:OB-fold nucleic acid binding domain-containing protein [Candidatus Culexmicrobium cathedralense]
MVNVKDLRPGMSRVNVEVKVLKAFEPRVVRTSDGRRLKLAEFTVGDDTGTIILTLWEENVGLVKQGDIIRIKNGYVTSFRGEPRLSIGRFGKIEQLNKFTKTSGKKSREFSL